MALKYLTASPESNSIKGSVIWERNDTSASGAGDDILLADQSGKVESWGVSLIPTAGTGKVQYTLSSRSQVIAGTAVWYDWDAGTVSVNTNDVLFGIISAVRCFQETGTVTIEVKVS